MHVPDSVRRFADHHDGCVTTAVLRAGGVDKYATRRLVRAGVLIPEHRGVYLIGHGAPTERRRWIAGVLAAGAGAALTGHAMAKNLGISRRRVVPVEIVVPRPRRPRRGLVLTVSRNLEPGDIVIHGGIPGTTFEWTLLAMAGSSTPGELARAMREYEFHHDDLDLDRIEHHLRRMGPTPGIDRVRQALADVREGGGGTDSRFEDRLWDAARGLRPSQPVANASFVTVSGKRFRLDMYWPEDRLCVEGDPLHHDRALRRENDRRRDLELAASGVHTIRIRESDFDADPIAALEPVRRFAWFADKGSARRHFR